MFCDKCGSKIDDNAKICSNCGNKINSNDEKQVVNKKVPKLMSKGKKIKLIVSAVLIIIIAIPIFICTSSSGRILINLYKYNSDKASEIYNHKFEYGKSSLILNIGINKVIDNTINDFRTKQVGFDEASGVLDAIIGMDISKFYDKSEKARREIEDLQVIAEADKLLEDKEYIKAISKYSSILEDSSVYDEAKESIKNAKNVFSKEALNQISEYIKNDKIDDTANLIIDARKLNMNDIVDELMTKYCDEMTNYLNKYFENNNYTDAEKIVTNIKKIFPNEEKVIELYDNLEKNYEKVIMDKAEKEFQSKNYEKAASTLEVALEQDEDNTNFESKYKEYKSYLPVFINEMDYLNKNDYISDNYSNLSDNTGKTYNRIYSIGGYGGDSYAEYLLNGNYTNFDGVAGVAYNDRDTDYSKFFEVYGDGVLLYTSPTFKASSMPKDFSINVTGVKILKIYYPKSDGSSSIASIFDGKLYNTNYIKSTNSETSTAFAN